MKMLLNLFRLDVRSPRRSDARQLPHAGITAWAPHLGHNAPRNMNCGPAKIYAKIRSALGKSYSCNATRRTLLHTSSAHCRAPSAPMNPTRLALLQNMPIFGGIRDDILQFILAASPIIAAPKGKFFFREREAASSMFVLEQGKVAILKLWKGHEYLLHELNTGDCFGEMSLIDLQPRSASVLATEDSVAIEIASATLYQIYRKDLEQLALIYMNMGREVSRRLRETDERMFQARIEAVAIGDDYIFKSV
jgi:hypothetical protein